MNLVEKITKSQIRTDIPEFRVGDTVRVDVKIIEGNRERIQAFEGIVTAWIPGLLMLWVLQANSDNGVVILSGWSAFSIAISGYLGDQAIKLFVAIWDTIYNRGGK